MLLCYENLDFGDIYIIPKSLNVRVGPEN